MLGAHTRHVIESGLRHPVNADELAEIIETGIKFFLFQRGQIPLPYDKLEVRHVSVKNRNFGERNKGEVVNDGNEGWERIKAMKLRRKEERKEAKIAKRVKKMMEKERVVKDTWDDLFKKFRAVLLSEERRSIKSVMLLFGPSVFNPVEVVEFSIDSNILAGLDGVNRKIDELKMTIRGFYKNIIMSSAFVEFTTKPLRSTCVHLCLLTDKIICDLDAWREINPLENFSVFGGGGSVLASSGTMKPNQLKFKSKKQLLHVKLQASNSVSGVNDVDNVNGCEDCSDSGFYYQIPLKYKGVPCFKL